MSCCPRIRAPEIQQIHEQKRIRSLQQIEAIFIQTKCTHSRKIPDYNFSIRIPHITRVDSTRYATWILTCSHRCHGDALRMSYAMNNCFRLPVYLAPPFHVLCTLSISHGSGTSCRLIPESVFARPSDQHGIALLLIPECYKFDSPLISSV